MRTSGGGWRLRAYLGISALILVIHPMLSVGGRGVTYVLISALAAVPLVLMLPGRPPPDRLPWQLLIGAMAMLTLGNGLIAAVGMSQAIGQALITVGHILLLCAAIVLVWLRGRNDLGGLLDASVAAIGFGGLLWTSVLYPRLKELHAGQGDRLSVLVGVLVLGGVLGALVRIRFVADRRLPALDLLVAALVLSLVGDILLAMTAGSMTSGRPSWVEVLIMVAYLCVGAAPFHPSVDDLVRRGPSPVDRLSVGRLVFLGAALAICPVVGGVRQMLHLDVDGALLAAGSLLISPLVMVRVGRLAHQRQRAEAALLHQATHDALTGLPNRAELLERLEAALRRERAVGTPGVVLLFCDLNGFKGVNDRLGHLAGDQLLIEVAGRLRAALRADDTLARYGGDEFLVLCESPAQDDAVARLCADIADALAAPFPLAGENVWISTSIGAVTSSGDTTADDLITRADQLMYRSKQRQREATASVSRDPASPGFRAAARG